MEVATKIKGQKKNPHKGLWHKKNNNSNLKVNL